MHLTETRSGLVVAEQASDYASVAAALKEHDPELRLVPQQSDIFDATVYKVFKYMGPERPAVFVFGWWNENLEPLPLSHRLVDEVKRHDRNQRGSVTDPDVHNERLKETRREDHGDILDTIADETAKSARRSPAFHRGAHLRRNPNRAGNQRL